MKPKNLTPIAQSTPREPLYVMIPVELKEKLSALSWESKIPQVQIVILALEKFMAGE